MAKKTLGKGRERVLLYGEPGSGKTFSALATLNQHPKTHGYYLDCDDGVERTLQQFPKPLANRISYFTCYTFQDLRDALETIKKDIKPDDWLILESCGQIWDMAQEHYIEKVFNAEIADFFIEMRRRLVEAKQAKKGVHLDGWKDWSIIKKLHNAGFMDIVTKRIKCNVIATSSAVKLEATDNPELHGFYSKVGYKAEGEKRNIYRFDSVLLLSRDRKGQYFVECIKNRGRKLFGKTRVDEQGAFLVYEAESY